MLLGNAGLRLPNATLFPLLTLGVLAWREDPRLRGAAALLLLPCFADLVSLGFTLPTLDQAPRLELLFTLGYFTRVAGSLMLALQWRARLGRSTPRAITNLAWAVVFLLWAALLPPELTHVPSWLAVSLSLAAQLTVIAVWVGLALLARPASAEPIPVRPLESLLRSVYVALGLGLGGALFALATGARSVPLAGLVLASIAVAVVVATFFWLRGLLGLMKTTPSAVATWAAGSLLLTALTANLVVDAWRGPGLGQPGDLVNQATRFLLTLTSMLGYLLLLAGLRAVARANQVACPPTPLLLLSSLGAPLLTEPGWVMVSGLLSLGGLAALVGLLTRLRRAAVPA